MDYQSNSHKSREAAEKRAATPEKKVAKVVTGQVVKKKRPVGDLFKEVFLGADFGTVRTFVLADIILPKMRDLMWDVISRGSGRWIYGDSRSSMQPPRPAPYGGRVQYNTTPIQAASRPAFPYPSTQANLPDQPRIRPAHRSIGDEFIFPQRSDAEAVLEQLVAIIEQYDVVTLADFYELAGLESSSQTVDNKFGWTVLPTVQIRQVSNGYVIDLPPLEEI